ncbi:MAG TPA: phenylacetate--CoA ligase family protein [Alphaproteobacteria bacterium]|nr:phenylacetate--CoA ligase family protein [Alphaproteobacteria bacterium]
MTQTEYFDELETRDPEVRDGAQFNALAEQLEHAKAKAPALAEHLARVDPAAVRSRAALARLPLLRRKDLIERQRRPVEDRNPFGGLTAIKTKRLAHIFAASGPLYSPAAMRPDYGRIARALFAAGFRRGSIVHNSFSYHLTPTGAVFEAGAHALGCPVVPAGTDNAELQVRTIVDVKPACYMGPPAFLKHLLDTARTMKAEIGIARALVSGDALSDVQRKDFTTRGVEARQCYATDEIGLIAYESQPGEGLILDEWVIVEIVKPGTGDPVPEGETGEVVVTTLNPDYPLIRFATGDLSAFLPGASACGRTGRRLKGLLGRTD